MRYNDIQGIVIIFGTKNRIKRFIDSNIQSIEGRSKEKIKLIEIKNNPYSLFRDIKNFIWKGD